MKSPHLDAVFREVLRLYPPIIIVSKNNEIKHKFLICICSCKANYVEIVSLRIYMRWSIYLPAS